jgi:hypothetical protein
MPRPRDLLLDLVQAVGGAKRQGSSLVEVDSHEGDAKAFDERYRSSARPKHFEPQAVKVDHPGNTEVIHRIVIIVKPPNG